jgi:hypothetical protein
MGEYFIAVILSGNQIVAWLCPHDYGCSLEIHDHYFVGNPFMDAVETYLYQNRGTPMQVVWASDYAPHEPNSQQSLYTRCCNEPSKKVVVEAALPTTRWVVNYTKKTSVCITGVPEDAMEVHCLPTLTAVNQDSSNYLGNDWNWIGDMIAVVDQEPQF